ncbi:membrane dipeptidase [Thermocatellispora tengchongensis]|uniref:Membrane dipeptidase n=1 Tax=Thermocatellispora tengchongensis TaxID=1073253 RepID=A0A840NVI3_9ACTN|nr:membrane dipeptidase [Thermocatellispora tengchongensis]MBB5131538.1 membrane dipeptidase [Thermocatellispora tengchongensis]
MSDPAPTRESYPYLPAGPPAIELADPDARLSRLDLGLDEEQEARARELMRSSIVISLHDHPQILPKDPARTMEYVRGAREHTAYRTLRRSGLTAVFDNLLGVVGAASPSGWKWDDAITALGMRLADIAHQEGVVVARSVADILAAHRDGNLAFVMGTESATPIENELDRIDILYGLGVRQMGIAYSEANALGCGLKEERDGGLTLFGRRAVARMNAIGVAIDVSHSGDRTALDTIEASDKPVLITHAGARAVWPTPRMKPDDVLLACARSGGVLGIEAAPHTTLSREHPRHTLESVMDHFRYCVDLMGIEHVAFGPDTFFGDHVGFHHALAAGLDVSRIIRPAGLLDFPEVEFVDGAENPGEFFGNVTRWLVKHGYHDDEIEAVLGGNILRVLGEIW